MAEAATTAIAAAETTYAPFCMPCNFTAIDLLRFKLVSKEMVHSLAPYYPNLWGKAERLLARSGGSKVCFSSASLTKPSAELCQAKPARQ